MLLLLPASVAAGGATVVQSPFAAILSSSESFVATRQLHLMSSVSTLVIGYARCFWPLRAWAHLQIADFAAAYFAVAAIAIRIH